VVFAVSYVTLLLTVLTTNSFAFIFALIYGILKTSKYYNVIVNARFCKNTWLEDCRLSGPRNRTRTQNFFKIWQSAIKTQQKSI